MEKIESFKINHLNLFSGLYVSRKDSYNNQMVTTFDMRFTAPNRETPLDFPAMHTLEHLGATFFRNSEITEQVVYFGPMGCRTGFYLVLFNEWTAEKLFSFVISFCDFVINFSGDIPGATARECGNYLEQDLEKAKIYAKKYKTDLLEYNRTVYPE
jgi:S-ribosylhomocysteine lyase